METQLYEKVHEIWKDKPDKTTPVWGEDLEHFEQGIYDNSANIKALSESGFITKTVNDLENYYKKSETYTKEEAAALIAGINTMKFSVVTELPTEDISTSTIYLVPAEDGKTGNIYDEYLYVNGNWEVIGNTSIDLSGYLTTTGDSTETLSSGNSIYGEVIDVETDSDGYPILDLTLKEKLRLKFKKISFAFDELVSTIKSKIPSLTNNLLATEPGTALDATQGKVLNDKIAVNSDAISQINSDLIPINLLATFVGNGTVTFSIPDISNYQVLILELMMNNITVSTTTICKSRFLNHRHHFVESVNYGTLHYNFKTNTSVEITGTYEIIWAIITGIKL